jgi:hypothetical protein
MGRHKMNEDEKKSKISITMNLEVCHAAKRYQPNMSKYIEYLVYQDLKKNNKIDETML